MQVFAYKMCNFLKKVFQCPHRTAVFLALYQRRGQGTAMERRLGEVRLGASRRQGHDAATVGTPEQLRRGPAATAATHRRARVRHQA